MVKRFHSGIAHRLGGNIASFRRHAGLTQERLAERLGVDIATVSRYETGSALPSLVTLEAIVDALHCTMTDLLAEKPPVQSAEGRRIEALIAPLSAAERKLALRLLASAAAFVQGQRSKRSRKRTS